MVSEDIQFSSEELSRYSRHITIPGFGLNAQKKLKAAKVLVIGCGGLGSPVLLYLAAAGVGTIGIVDFDLVEDSNLQRQVLFGVDVIGQLKVSTARKRLEALNPHIKIITYPAKLTAGNAMDIIKDFDVVADGSDNFQTRYLINDTCVLLGKPFVYASVHQFEGQVSVFNLMKTNGELGPNYRDLYPVPPSPGLVQDCAAGGVLGVLPGIIGSMQALEVIKVITGLGESLNGRLYIFDALSIVSRVLKIKPDPGNPVTGKNPTLKSLIDYEQFCGIMPVEPGINEITPLQLEEWKANGEDIQVIDVREPHEYDVVNMGGELIPMSSILDNAQRIDRHKKVVVHCKTGVRSAFAIRELQQKLGFNNLYNLKGGIIAYLERDVEGM